MEEERCLFVNSVWVVVVTVGNGRVHGHFAKFKLLISSELYRNCNPNFHVEPNLFCPKSCKDSKMPGAGLEECCLLSFQDSAQDSIQKVSLLSKKASKSITCVN